MIRLAPYIAARSSLSRRQAEDAICKGRVTVRGETVLTFCVPELTEVALDGNLLQDPPSTEMWAYHKPVGCLVTKNDPFGRETVFDQIHAQGHKELFKHPLVSIGRLDYHSEGLLLFTNNPLVAHHLERSRWTRTYSVLVRGELYERDLEELAMGSCIRGIQYRPCQVSVQWSNSYDSNLTITLCEGKNREVRILMESIGLTVERLVRISFGPFELGDLDVKELCNIPQAMIEKEILPILSAEKHKTLKHDAPIGNVF